MENSGSNGGNDGSEAAAAAAAAAAKTSDEDVQVVDVDDRTHRERILSAEVRYCKSQLVENGKKIQEQSRRITLLEKQVEILVETHNMRMKQQQRKRAQKNKNQGRERGSGGSGIEPAAATAAAPGESQLADDNDGAMGTADATIAEEAGVIDMSIEDITDPTTVLSPSKNKKLRTLAAKRKPKVKKRKSLPGTKIKHTVMGPKRILSCLALLRQNQKIVNASRKQVAVLSDVREKSLACLLSGLKKQGLVEYPSKETVKITEKGINEVTSNSNDSTDPNLESVEDGGTNNSNNTGGSRRSGTATTTTVAAAAAAAVIPTSNRIAQDKIKNSYLRKGKAMNLFDTIRDGHIHDRALVMEQSQISNKQTFGCILSVMKSMGIVHYPSTTTVQLTDMCFPFGRNQP